MSQQTTTIWLARHAEAHNPRAILYGRLPRVPLSEAGRRQAQALGDFLADRQLGAVYSSPMLRARQTAWQVARRHPEVARVRVDRDLHEILTGWQGEPVSAIDGIGWDFYGHTRTPNDESLATIRDRMDRWVRRVLRRHPGGEVVGVSHGDPVLVLVAWLSGRLLDLASVRPRSYPPPATVYRLSFDATGTCQSQELIRPLDECAAPTGGRGAAATEA